MYLDRHARHTAQTCRPFKVKNCWPPLPPLLPSAPSPSGFINVTGSEAASVLDTVVLPLRFVKLKSCALMALQSPSVDTTHQPPLQFHF
jgi:hypothetical protein